MKPTKAQLAVMRDVKFHEDRGEWVWNSGNDRLRYTKRTVEVLVYERQWLEEYPNPHAPIGFCVRLTPAGRAILEQYKEV